jgi:hypothetical protein
MRQPLFTLCAEKVHAMVKVNRAPVQDKSALRNCCVGIDSEIVGDTFYLYVPVTRMKSPSQISAIKVIFLGLLPASYILIPGLIWLLSICLPDTMIREAEILFQISKVLNQRIPQVASCLFVAFLGMALAFVGYHQVSQKEKATG